MKITPLEELRTNDFSSFDLNTLIEHAEFDYINPDVRQFNDQEVSTGNFSLVYFGKPTYTKEIFDELNAKDLTPASVSDLIAFSIVYPDLQRSFPIVTLGSAWENKPGNLLVPALWGGEQSRELNICSISTKWVGEDHFLVISQPG